MINTIFSPDAYVKDTATSKGRGAFAARDFAEGELVEECPVIVLLRPIQELPPRIRTVVFNWGNLTGSSPATAIALGYGSMYNHDNPANMRYEGDAQNSSMRFIAVRPIKQDEELTVNYNPGSGSPVSDRDIWFERHGIPLLKGG